MKRFLRGFAKILLVLSVIALIFLLASGREDAVLGAILLYCFVMGLITFIDD